MLAVGAALALVLAGCGGDDDDDGNASGNDATTTTGDSADAGAIVSSADTDLGEILVDGDGMTLYLFDNDSDGTSTCIEQCAANWPPLVATGETVAVGEGLDASIFSTITRDDGTEQVTVNGLPLYTFGGDRDAGDLNGQGFGDLWWASDLDGRKVDV